MKKITKTIAAAVLAAAMMLPVLPIPAAAATTNEDGEIIGYEFVSLGKMMDFIKGGMDANDAMKKATGHYGQFDDAAKYIDPRHE